MSGIKRIYEVTLINASILRIPLLALPNLSEYILMSLFLLVFCFGLSTHTLNEPLTSNCSQSFQ